MGKPIGGYFELEIRDGEHFHPDALKLSTARNCLEYLLLSKGYKKIYLPYYTCEVLLEPINRLGLTYEFYSIDEYLDPIIDKDLNADEALLYTNYFGIKQKTVIKLARKYSNLIVDNAQAFFAKPIDGVDTFYSVRKFFGVPDGAYLYTNIFLDKEFETMQHNDHINHLIGRLVDKPESYYLDFVSSENCFANIGIHKMSVLSEKILKGLDYLHIQEKRRFNFKLLHRFLGSFNLLKFDDIDPLDVPMVYPFFFNKTDLSQLFLTNRVFVPKYWSCVLGWTNEQSFEFQLSENLYPIPIDQRYDKEQMEYVLDLLKPVIT